MEKIQNTVKMLMKEQGVTYDMLAKRLGCSRQNAWLRATVDKIPKISGMWDILNALGCDITLTKKDAEKEPDMTALHKAVKKTELPYANFEKEMEAMGYSISIRKQKNFKKSI